MNDKNSSGIHLWLVLRKAHHAIESVAAGQIESMQMCYTDFGILEVLLHKGPLPVQEIGRKVLLTSGSITTAIQRLETRGYVNVLPDPRDARIRNVSLNASGKTFIRRQFASHAQTMNDVSSHLSDRERIQLIGLLKKYGKGISEISADGSDLTRKSKKRLYGKK